MAMNLGVMISMLLGEVLPPDLDVEALKGTEMWRMIYFWFPGSLYVFILLAYLFTIRYDSIKNLIKTKQYEYAT